LSAQSEANAGYTRERRKDRIALRLVALGCVMAASGSLIFGYLGWLHPAFDSFAHFRIHLAVVIAVMAVPLMLLRFWPEALLALALGTIATLQTTGIATTAATPRVEPATTPVYRLLHLNRRFDNPTPEAVLSLVGRLRPDMVTLNEVSAMWVDRLKLLEASYPYQVVCKRPIHVGGVAVLSRRPFADTSSAYCGRRSDFALARLDMGGRVLEVAALHLGWPWPYEQRWQVDTQYRGATRHDVSKRGRVRGCCAGLARPGSTDG
jgi:endonuclease/exonuclease/phosphatase (EEP) superfamily protein YafD